MALILTTDELVAEYYTQGCWTIKLAQIEKAVLRRSMDVVVTLREKGPLGMFRRSRVVNVAYLEPGKVRELLGQLRKRLEHLEWQSQ